MFFSHARKNANLALARQFLDGINIANFVGAPDQRDCLGAKTLNSQQLQHRRMVFLQQFGMDSDASLFEKFLEVYQHSLTDAGNLQHLLGFADDVFYGLGMVFDGLGGVAIRPDTKRVLSVDFEHIGGFVENAGNCFIVHGIEIKSSGYGMPEWRRGFSQLSPRQSAAAGKWSGLKRDLKPPW